MITAFFKNLIAFCKISLFFLILSLNVQAQEGVKQRFFTSQNGLKISWVTSITKSQNNAVTIVHSSKFDLSRYDGYNFDYTISPTGILGKTFEDFSGNLWSINERNLDNVNFYSNDKWQNLEFDAGIPFIPTPGIGNRLLFIRDGDLKEFDKFKNQIRIIKRAEESQIGQFIDMTAFQDGSVWITGEDGVAKYLVQCDTCDTQEQWIDFQVPKSYGLYHFNKPFEGKNGELSLMSKSFKSKHNVLAGFDGKTWQKLYTSQTDEVHYGWRGHDNSLWIIKGTQPPPPLKSNLNEWDLFHIQQGNETRIIKNRVLNRVLNDVVVEPNGAFWLATGSGLAHFTPNLWRRVGAGADINQRIKKIHEDSRGRLWFAAEHHFFLWSNDKWESHQFNPVVFIGDICSLKNGLLVVGISETGGLALFNPVDKSSTVTFPFGDEKVRYYDQDKNGNCFIVIQDSDGILKLIRYDGEHIETLAVDLKIDGIKPGTAVITDIIQARNEEVWIVTFSDVMVFKNGIKKSFDLKTTFEWGISTSVLELENGNIWISGSKGIIQYDGQSWSLVQSPEFETARMMILSGDSSIWVASGTGIHRLINGTWVSNSNEEGLPNTTIFDVFEDQQGDIWAATLEGAYRYYSEADTDAPETIIPSDMNSRDAVPSGELQFVFHGQDKWSNTLDDRLRYSYRFDEDSWTPFENIKMVRGVGLSSGPHVFEVRAMDRNGNIDQSPASWEFTVMLPWYLETYFIILLLITIGLIILLIRLAINRHKEVEKLVIIRTAELKKSKEKVEESERLLLKVAENYPHSFIAIIEKDLTVGFSAGQEFERLNLDPDTFLGLTIEQVFGEHSQIIKENYLKTFNGEETTFELFINNQHQLYKTVPLIYENNKIIKIMSVVENITERKQAEIEIKKLNEELEQRVIQRTSQLEASNEELEAFSYSISHDLRAPLRAIDGFTEILMDNYIAKLDDEAKRLGAVIQNNSKKMGILIDDLLSFSRLNRKKMGHSLINMEKLVNEVIKELFESDKERKIDINIGKLPDIKADRSLLKQVIVNLLSNAFKFTEHVEKAVIEIDSFSNGQKNTFYIKDNGAGFNMKYVDKIFDVFQRLHSEKEFKGTGVGLAIAQRIVSRHGGKIWAEAEVNKGATFYFSLPIIKI